MSYESRLYEITMHPEDAAKVLGVSKQTVDRYCREGKLQAEKFGSSWAVCRNDVMLMRDNPELKRGPSLRREAMRDRDKLILKMVEEGKTLEYIALYFSLTKSRISQMGKRGIDRKAPSAP